VRVTGDPISWYNILDLIESVAITFPISSSLTRTGVVLSSTNEDDFDFSRYNNSADLQRTVRTIPLQSESSAVTYSFVKFNRIMLSSLRKGIRTICILISSGQLTLESSDETKAMGVDVFAIGVTDKVRPNHEKSLCHD
jgi:hypothetical protein